jgi:tRNA/tmRNA/rRNA uracil-C5-methylase (TrmA/RlmC/RlmD family)
MRSVLTGAGGRRHAPRRVAYVACDPAALARDLRTARSHGWRLAELRVFDLFPMTHHVECVAVLEPDTA